MSSLLQSTQEIQKSRRIKDLNILASLFKKERIV